MYPCYYLRCRQSKGIIYMKKLVLACASAWNIFTTRAEIVFAQDREVFVKPPNYDESKIAPYTLEDPLAFVDGRKVKNAADWAKRRKEILGIFAKEMDSCGDRPFKMQRASCALYGWG